jgi:hypothetical protein
MEKGEPIPQEEFQRVVLTQLAKLQERQSELESRLVISEGLLSSILKTTPISFLSELADHFDQAVDLFVAQIPPKHQRPELWEKWSALIAGRLGRPAHLPPKPAAEK